MSAFLLACAAVAAPRAQDAEWVETRFHRVHLVNGNFIDGQLVKSTSRGVVLRMKEGEFTIRLDQILRNGKGEYLVEVIKLRSIGEKARIAPKPKDEAPFVVPPPPDPREGAARTDKTGPLPPRVVPSSVSAAVAKQVDSILEQSGTMPKEEVNDLFVKFPPLGDEGMVYLASILESLDDPTLAFASTALGFMRREPSIPILIQRLESKRPAVRLEAARALGVIGDSSAERPLIALLKDPAGAVRGAAAVSLRTTGRRDAIAPTAELCLDLEEPVRQKAFATLVEIGQRIELNSECVGTLGALLRRTEGGLRGEVVGALGRTGGEEAGEILQPLLLDREPAIRAAAVIALVDATGPKAAGPLLERLPREQDVWPRVQLALAARKLNLRPAIETFIAWLTDSSPHLRQLAQDGLKELTREDLGPEQEKWAAWWKVAKLKE